MFSRTALVFVPCVAFLLTQGLGVHVHGSQRHDRPLSAPAQEHAAHFEPTTHVVAESDADHLDSHLLHGDIDLDAGTVVGKLPLLKFFVAFLAIQLSWIFVLPILPLRISLPLLRPPPYCSGSFVLPPSQAPPCLA